MRQSPLTFSVPSRIAAIIAGALLLGGSTAAAQPSRLQCSVSNETADGASASRTLAITYDEEAKTLVVEDGAQRQDYKNVTISTVSINGAGTDTTIGVDRSSWSIAFQTYRPEGVTTLVGRCAPAGGQSR